MHDAPEHGVRDGAATALWPTVQGAHDKQQSVRLWCGRHIQATCHSPERHVRGRRWWMVAHLDRLTPGTTPDKQPSGEQPPPSYLLQLAGWCYIAILLVPIAIMLAAKLLFQEICEVHNVTFTPSIHNCGTDKKHSLLYRKWIQSVYNKISWKSAPLDTLIENLCSWKFFPQMMWLKSHNCGQNICYWYGMGLIIMYE
jgi:hypothetical protein